MAHTMTLAHLGAGYLGSLAVRPFYDHIDSSCRSDPHVDQRVGLCELR
jgi:hypothetical protein